MLHNKSGSVIFPIVMAVLLILGALGFSLYRSMTEKANFVNAHANAALLDFAAMEMEAVIFDELGKQLKKSDSSIFKDLLKTATDATELDVSGYNGLWDKKFSFLGKKEFARLSWSSTVKFVNFSGLAGTGKWNDPFEKLCRINVDLDLSIGHIASKKLRKLYQFSRPCKLQRLGLPVVSKFSLFVKNPEKTNGNTEGYNCFENMHDGNPTQANYSGTQKSMPLILFNSTKVGLTDITDAGYVFLGGQEDIELHTTAGNHPDYGESFLFCSMSKPLSSVIVFDMNVLPSTAAFAPAGIQLATSPSTLQGVLGIRSVVFGFYSVNNLGESMNYLDTLSRWFDPSNMVTMNSSFLHIYGSMSNPTPTMVLGRVKRTYARYAKLVARLAGRQDVQGVCWLKNPAPMNNTAGQSLDSWSQVPFPGSLDDKKTGISYSVATAALSMISLFGSPSAPATAWSSYLDYASGLCNEEYNRVYEYVFRKDDDKDFPPSKKTFEAKFGTYQQTGETFALTRKNTGNTLFQSDLNKISTLDLLKDRISIQVRDQAEFDQLFKNDDGSYDLRGQVIKIQGGAFEFPAGAKIHTSGIIAVAGKISLKGGVTCDSKVLLSLVSIGDNITLEGSNEEVQANLVALDGTVVSASKSSIKIKGGVAVNKLSPKDWKYGGQVTYDERFDPIQSSREDTYVVAIADYHDRWKVDQVTK
ncbi:MAG: hypothetical protein HQM09_15370 [Candidatus Riflebacteria bacterium]|nr:hypothetical protein [Candidatus Riflebacteria bacterium]